ncbi:rhomboid family intramembrane serine protease [Sphingomicrobium lutaoense]|uniref:Membrane associated rhomboid family serine protease n=1 Tax=Sphingomicrobium lutaoense TaxID=515949 RepID=A0A839Z4Y2_9SPHN|nr:rhomboid family intramembrane serine protease [Sphingomicrobium lutaoense]MBB3763724.1 membrane associated rhomboid family serine protease [Sphingomicrobium lutaoense]
MWAGATRTVTFWIAVLTVLASVLVLAAGLLPEAAMRGGMIPVRLSGLADLPGALPAWLTPLSATLLHGDYVHLISNLLILLWCGMSVERILGKLHLVLIYLVGAYASGVAQWLTEPEGLVPMVGASGAVSAVLGAYALAFSAPKAFTRSPALNRLINAAWLLAFWVFLQWAIDLLGNSGGPQIATAAHVGGFVAGMAMFTPLLIWKYRRA